MKQNIPKIFNSYCRIIFILTLFYPSCAKKEIQNEKFYYGNVEVSMTALPNSPSIDIFYDGKKMLELNPGATDKFSTMAEVSHKLALYKAGTDTLIADTLITPVKYSTLAFKVGYSEEFDLHGFLGQSTSISPDSCRFQLYDNLPVTLQPDDVPVDAYFCKYDPPTDSYIESGIVFTNFTKKKLHPLIVTIPLNNTDGSVASYAMKFKNTASGIYIKDGFLDEETALTPIPGKFLLMTVEAKKLIGKLRYRITPTEL